MRSLAVALTACFALLASHVALAACDHPYFPLKEAQTRVFKSSSGHETRWKVTKVDGAKATIETTSVQTKDADPKSAPSATSMVVECTGDGIVLDLSKMTGGGQAGGGMEVKVVKHSGVTIPAAGKMKAGETFESTQSIEMTNARLKQPMHMEGRTTSKIIGAEKVKVAAGEFDAMRIESETQMTMQMPDRPGKPAGAAGAMTMTSKGVLWVVKGVGMVKSEQTVAGMSMPGGAAPAGSGTTVASELVSYSK